MSYRAQSATPIQHPIQAFVQRDAHDEIFEAKGITEALEALAEKYLDMYKAAAPEERYPKLKLLRWAAEAICDHIAMEIHTELVFLQYDPNTAATKARNNGLEAAWRDVIAAHIIELGNPSPDDRRAVTKLARRISFSKWARLTPEQRDSERRFARSMLSEYHSKTGFFAS